MNTYNDNELNQLVAEVNELKSQLKYVYEKDRVIYEKVIKLQEEIFSKTKQVIYLIDICRLEKRMLGITERYRRVAAQAFNFKPIEKTLHFFLESHLTNKNPVEGLRLLDKSLFIKNDKNLQAIRDLYYGSLYGVKGDYLSYNKLICKAKKNYVPGIYYQLMNFVSDYELGIDDDLFLGENYKISTGIVTADIDFIFSISCDMKYFSLYVDLLLESFFYFNKNSIVHIYIVNCRDLSEVGSVVEKYKGKLLISHFECPERFDYRPISAVLRLLAIYELINEFKKPVVFGEVDGLVTGDFLRVIDLGRNGAAQLVRVIGSYLPWQRFTCGLGVFMPTSSGIKAAKLLSRYVKGIFNRTEKHWWADQSALEAAIRYSLLVDPEYEFNSIPMETIGDIFFTPTGSDSHDKKLFLLAKKRAEVFL